MDLNFLLKPLYKELPNNKYKYYIYENKNKKWATTVNNISNGWHYDTNGRWVPQTSTSLPEEIFSTGFYKFALINEKTSYRKRMGHNNDCFALQNLDNNIIYWISEDKFRFALDSAAKEGNVFSTKRGLVISGIWDLDGSGLSYISIQQLKNQ